MNQEKNTKPIKKEKKAWNKPKLISGKEIGFFLLGGFQSSTGYSGTPS